MLVKDFLAGFDGLESTVVVFRDDARREIARGHLRGIMQAIKLPQLNRDYTLERLLDMEVQDETYDCTFPYEYLTVYVGRW